MSLYLVVRNPTIVDVDVQNIMSICVFSIDCNPTLNTNVLVSLGNPNQAQYLDLYFTDGTPITFDQVGTFEFQGVTADSCATILGTFREPGDYKFNFALLEEKTNAPIDTISEVVRVVGESSGTNVNQTVQHTESDESTKKQATKETDQSPQVKTKQVGKEKSRQRRRSNRPNALKGNK
ncbi:hypothetical protein [Guptibacillus algicola]|uniref:hypothetical protein n=1 Tax=Guptibacillus algicola TaxID=225844 RepID=UPI001CD1DF9F|nr:hypothetical protein [Alkalihalobacillus algicola]MCA0987183.1 hypothetical protein [Alkalihalobacillus algicola]